jgi:hypothetical protein
LLNVTMTIESMTYWGSFVIPVVLLGIGAWIQKLVDGRPFRREHFFLGLDLTVYFLASTMVNFLDIAKKQPMNAMSVAWTVVLLLAALFMLFFQMGIHQTWRSEAKRGRMQAFMLCYFSNGLGILLLYGFVKLKAGGLI